MAEFERFEDDVEDEKIITNDDLMCKDCKHRLTTSSGSCVKFSIKPLRVFTKKECEYYQKDLEI